MPDARGETQPTDPAQPARPRSVLIGLALFAVGLACLVITVTPFFFGDHNRPVWLNVACMLAPLGFIVAVTGGIRAGRRDQREAAAAVKSRTR
ncbi:hypothetical protein BH10ACT8_BH10ACT8_25290 [soil metagenome]|jgi:uncharacterized membrane protein YhdT